PRALEARAVAREVAGAQEPAHPFGERADGGGDVPAVEALTRGRDARRPVAAPARVGLHEPAEGAREGGLHEELAHTGRAAARIENVGATGRIEIELAPALRNGEELVHVLVHGEAVL